MRRYGPPGLSSAERADMWSRWRAGYHVREIARAFGRDHGSICSLLARRGGIAPSVRTRGSSALTLIEREDISRGLACGESGRTIAARIGRAASNVSREIIRHGGRDAYRANAADEGAWELALRPKACLLAVGGELLIMSRWESRIVRGNAVPKHNYQGLPSRIAVRRPDWSA